MYVYAYIDTFDIYLYWYKYIVRKCIINNPQNQRCGHLYLYVYPVITCASGPPWWEHRVEPLRGELIGLCVNTCWKWFWRACVVYIQNHGGLVAKSPKYRILILLHLEIPSTVAEWILTHVMGPRGPFRKRLPPIWCNTATMSLSFIPDASRTSLCKIVETEVQQLVFNVTRICS